MYDFMLGLYVNRAPGAIPQGIMYRHFEGKAKSIEVPVVAGTAPPTS